MAFDTCGYCGEQFPNDPSPDWDARAAHLTNVHKFGECNQSKKFFRADHFRQHLKHSHAGTSGKWTNMLESACMKDEPNPQSQDASPSQGAPIANMGMASAMNQANMGQPNMGPHVGQGVGQPSMGQAGLANMGPASMGQPPGLGPSHMSQQHMAQASIAAHQAQQLAQMDMSNIDPTIGLQQMGGMTPMGTMGTMSGPAGRGMNMQTGQIRSDRIEELP